MKRVIHLENTMQQLALLCTGCLLFGGIAWLTILRFTVGALADSRIAFDRAELIRAAAQYPTAARLQARAAARLLESEEGVEQSYEETLTQATLLATRAVHLSPANYEYRVLLAAAEEGQGHVAEAEAGLRQALNLAPNRTDIHWRLANLLLRAGKVDDSLGEFRLVLAAAPHRISAILDLLWAATDGATTDILSIADTSDDSRIASAQFLLQKAKVDEAVQLINRATPAAKAASPTTASFLQGLLDPGRADLSYRLWLGVIAPNLRLEGKEVPLLWDGGFEQVSRKNPYLFGWHLQSNKYADVTVDTAKTHSGAASLQLHFTGVDTTRVEDVIQQLVVVEPGHSYQLQGYALAKDLVSSEPVRLAITPYQAKEALALSAPIRAESDNWQLVTITFTAPSNTSLLKVTMQRIPRYSYDDPTRGTLWFDDFTLTEAPTKKA